MGLNPLWKRMIEGSWRLNLFDNAYTISMKNEQIEISNDRGVIGNFVYESYMDFASKDVDELVAIEKLFSSSKDMVLRIIEASLIESDNNE